MATPERDQNLIYENVPFERRWMRFERSMWMLLSLLLLAGCFGVFGQGAYARRTQESGPLKVEYDRIVRSRTQPDFVVTLDTSATQAGQVRLLLTGAVTGKARLFDVVPKPATEELLEKGVALTFKTLPGQSGRVRFIQKVEGIGRVQSHVSLDGGSSVAMDQVILP